MTSENARRVLKSMHYILKGDEVFSTQTQQIALEEGMLALEVVEKIKKAYSKSDSSYMLDDTIYDILCEAYGSYTDCESWLKEYKE